MERRAVQPDAHRIEFRVGVSLSDVLHFADEPIGSCYPECSKG